MPELPKATVTSCIAHPKLKYSSGLIIEFWYFVIFLFILTSYNSFSQTNWYKYPGNPVFESSRGDWDEVPIPKVVMYENNQYQMWYRGLGSSGVGIGFASSKDGIHWDKYDENPLIFDTNSWDAGFYSFDIIKRDSMYFMWYAGPSKEDNTGCIGYAWSDDRLNWTKHPKPVLLPSEDEDWDAWGLGGLQVIYDGTSYHMWYNGSAAGLPVIGRVGYASSYDGIHWKKYNSNPILDIGEPGTWEDHAAIVEAVEFNGVYFEMWYHGWNLVQHEIGYASSMDGINWNKSPGNPVLRAGELGTWDAWLTTRPAVIKMDSVYRMWYYGHDNITGNCGYATTSVDEFNSWDSTEINKTGRVVRVRVINKVDYVKVDSLLGIFNELSGKELIDAINKLALAFSLNDAEKSLAFAEEALKLSEEILYPKGKAMALYCKGNGQYVIDNYSDALATQLSALRIYDSLDMKYEVGNLLSQIASIHSYTGLDDLACKYYEDALKEFEKINDTGFIINSLYHLGLMNLSHGDTISALLAFQRGVSLTKENKYIWNLVRNFEAIGLCYSGRELDSALYYFNKASLIWDTLHQGYLNYNYLIKAEAYMASGSEYFDLAEQNLLKSYEMSGDGRHMQVRLLYGMASLFFKTGRYEKAREFLNVTLHMCRNYLTKQNHQMFSYLNDKLEYEMYLKPYMEKIYLLQYRLDTTLHNEISAMQHYILATQWKDSLYDQQNRRQIAMMQGQYETESAQNQISMLEKDNEVKNLTIKQSRNYLFLMGVFVVIIVLMAWLFIRQNKIKAEHQTIILEQKLLRLQMNPHFIFNALSNILNFINRKDTVNAANYLTSFSKLLRSTLESSREDYILLEEEIKSLKNYLNLQLLRYTGKFEYSIEIDEEIDIENAIIPPMLIQPFIENAIEHGIRHKQGKGHIYIRFRLEEKKVICEVEDDGVGREKAWETKYQKRKTHKSLATEIITERIQSLNKKLKQKIKLNIIDLKTATNEPSGTRVVLDIPYLID